MTFRHVVRLDGPEVPVAKSVLIVDDEAHSLTATEIAELLGESVGAIKIRLHRARRKLQEIMEIGCAVSQSMNGVPCCEAKLPGDVAHNEFRRQKKKRLLDLK